MVSGTNDDGGTEQQLHAFTRQSADRARLIAGLAGIVLLVGLAVLERAAPDILIGPVVFAAGVVMAVAPAVAAVERLLKRGGRLVADGILAALVAYLTAFAIDLYVHGPAPEALRLALTTSESDGSSTPIHLYIATVVAFVSIVGFGDRLIVRNATWFSLAITAAAALVEHRTTLVGVLVSFALGRTVAYGIRWARGAADTRPTGEAVMTALAGADLAVADWTRTPDGTDGARRYAVDTEAGTRLAVTVLDRDRLAVGLAYRLYQRLRLRRPAQSQGLASLQHIVEQRTLLALAVRDSGIRTPKLAAVRKLGSDAVMIAYQQIEGRTLDQLEPEELTDPLLDRIWRLTAELHRHQISHRRLSTGAFLVDDAGVVWLMRLEAGEVAASELQQRLDDVELLATLGVLVGPERAVSSARAVLGDVAMGALLPLLRPAVVSAETRAQLRRHKSVVGGVAEEILAFQPEAPQSPTVVLERLRPRTILSGLGGVIAAYFLISQFSGQPLGSLFKGMSWPWAALALGGSALTYVAASMGLGGFVPQRLNKLHLLLAQFAASFVTLVTPAAVGGVALNTRFLQKAGVSSGLAVTSMAASQVANFGAFLLLVMLLGSISGSSQGSYLPPSSVIVTVLLAVGVLGLVATAVPPVRKFVVTRVKPFFSGVGPRMLELVSDPRKLLVGLAGSFMLPLVGSLALWASVRAFVPDQPISFATVAVVFLIGKTAGSVVPTPGGLGAVEALLSGGLTTATGIGASTAFSAVILFRLFTFWLPIVPGWLATTWLQKRGAL
ncbi:flippase-like domain-containing protein [Streptomyces sp. NPDC050738]|uniref:flippase-like domain-containing protein n=1 Tax=Streptomyces sp. NPDC050738 TaxID=3154744 RepID=UPI00343765C6